MYLIQQHQFACMYTSFITGGSVCVKIKPQTMDIHVYISHSSYTDLYTLFCAIFSNNVRIALLSALKITT